MRQAIFASVALLVCLLGTGCRHKQPQYVAVTLPPLAPVPVDKAPESGTGPLVQPVPVPVAPVTPVKLPKRVKPKKKPAVPVVASTPVQVAGTGAPVPAASVVGALSAGGEGSPEKRKQAEDLLTTLEKRLAALPLALVDAQKEQLTRVKHFWDEARAALNAGDSDGAFTLATKAKVLLDDVAK